MTLLGSTDVSYAARLRQLAATRRGPMALLAAGIAILALTGAYAVYAEDDLPNCHDDAAILSYPRYTNKGLIDSYEYRCGSPDRSCTLKEHTAKGPVYTCSPFALGGRGAIL